MDLMWIRRKVSGHPTNSWLLGPEEARPSRVVSVELHGVVGPWAADRLSAEIQYDAIGWTIQLGTGNPEREVGLPEVLALTPTTADRYEIVGQMVEAHLNLLAAAEDRLAKFRADQTTTRAAVDSAVRLMRDIARLRREAYIAREATTPDVEAEINRRLAE